MPATPSAVVTGTFLDLGGNPLPNVTVSFLLEAVNANDGSPWIISGTTILTQPPAAVEVKTDVNGSFSATLWGNDVITSPVSFYAVQAGNFSGRYQFLQGNNYNLLTATPIVPFPGTGTFQPPTGAQNANTFYAGPTSGGAQVPSFRTHVAADINGLATTFASVTSGSANPASAGVVRLANADAIKWRNNANNGDILLNLNGGANGNIPADLIEPQSGFLASFYAGGNSASIATAGTVRLAPVDTVSWRNNANGANLPLGINNNDSLIYNSFVMPQIPVLFDSGASAAAINTTTLYTTGANGGGLYRLNYYLYTVIPGNAVNITGTFGWTDDSGSSAHTLTTANIDGSTRGANSTSALGLGQITFYSKPSSTITYATALSGSIGAGAYVLRLRLEYLG
jgi:hypothetical protein